MLLSEHFFPGNLVRKYRCPHLAEGKLRRGTSINCPDGPGAAVPAKPSVTRSGGIRLPPWSGPQRFVEHLPRVRHS